MADTNQPVENHSQEYLRPKTSAEIEGAIGTKRNIGINTGQRLCTAATKTKKPLNYQGLKRIKLVGVT